MHFTCASVSHGITLSLKLLIRTLNTSDTYLVVLKLLIYSNTSHNHAQVILAAEGFGDTRRVNTTFCDTEGITCFDKYFFGKSQGQAMSCPVCEEMHQCDKVEYEHVMTSVMMTNQWCGKECTS